MLVGPDEIQTIGIEAFEKINAASWVANASLWSEAGTATPLRNAMLAEVDAVVAQETARLAAPPRLVDLGCADGGYLARLHDAGFSGALHGFDLCPELVTRARIACPAAYVEVGDLVGDVALPLTGAAIATCLLTLVEIARYRRVLEVGGGVLAGGGLFIATVLDPTVEVLRFVELKRGRPGTLLYDVAGELAIGSLFKVQGEVSSEPYYRFVRPIDRYIEALLASGFSVEQVTGIQGEGYPFQAQPRAIMICARKLPEAGSADVA